MKKSELLSKMKKLNACGEATKWVTEQPFGAQSIWNKCARGDWMLWYAARCGVDRKSIVKAACLCARSALKYVHADERRPMIAIETAERWLQGEATLDEVRKAAYAAHAAAYASASAAAASTSAAAAAYAAASASASAAADAAADAAAYAAHAAAAYDRKAAIKHCADIVRSVIAEVPR